MHEVIKECIVNHEIDKVWDLITDLNNQLWREDIDHIDVVDENTFVEYDKQGYETHFKIIKKEKNKVYMFTIHNDNIEGEWIGELTSIDSHTTKIVFTERIEVKKKIMNLMAKSYLKKQQNQYFEYLKKALDK